MDVNKGLSDVDKTYLRVIYQLSLKQAFIHPKDLTNIFETARSTTSLRLKLLIKNDYIKMNDQKEITLTTKGEEIGKQMYQRYQLLLVCYKKYLGLDMATINKEISQVACLLSSQTIQNIYEKLNHNN